MPPAATVGLVGSRVVDDGLQSTNKKTVTDFAFPSNSRTPNQISIPHEGAHPNKNPKMLGDSYTEGVEDTHLCAAALPTMLPAEHALSACVCVCVVRLKFFFLSIVAMYATYMLQYVQ